MLCGFIGLPSSPSHSPRGGFPGVFTVPVRRQMHQTGQLSDGDSGRPRWLVNPRPVSAMTPAKPPSPPVLLLSRLAATLYSHTDSPVERHLQHSSTAICLERQGEEIVGSRDRSAETTSALFPSDELHGNSLLKPAPFLTDFRPSDPPRASSRHPLRRSSRSLSSSRRPPVHPLQEAAQK